ncbi:MAG: 1-deoxy-D-xylulose-5-phosphate reductoisomerase [Candidatus Hydrogenedentes bacterium]|nr:1-deoxy-D-xylulose-5-phosphate reductoisomerase [Candidatus Hydrogenedentota bacterium]
MDTARRRVTILGSTGSIGTSALDVVRHYPDRLEVVGLAAHSNVDLLADQVREFRPRHVAVADRGAARRLAGLLPDVAIAAGPEGLEEIAGAPADVVLCGMVGAAGLKPVLSAIAAGNAIALANKEPLVMAGPLIMERARARGVHVLPVDSEHNAIFQCLQGHRVEDVQCIHLTASGGPFYGTPRESLAGVTPAQATRHPTWNMGAKISVDSATLMNKGLEVVEAMWLFGLPLEKVAVVIHPQSIVHSLVEFTDGSILAHLGLTNMKFPIQYALTWPDRVPEPMGRLDLTTMRELTFAKPDFAEFPCLAYAMEAAHTGGTAPAILNAANESAVAAFCKGQIEFLRISDVVRGVMDDCPVAQDVTLESVLEADGLARERAGQWMAALGV